MYIDISGCSPEIMPNVPPSIRDSHKKMGEDWQGGHDTTRSEAVKQASAGDWRWVKKKE